LKFQAIAKKTAKNILGDSFWPQHVDENMETLQPESMQEIWDHVFFSIIPCHRWESDNDDKKSCA